MSSALHLAGMGGDGYFYVEQDPETIRVLMLDVSHVVNPMERFLVLSLAGANEGRSVMVKADAILAVVETP